MNGIMSILSGMVSLFSKLASHFAKKDIENQIKNSYEKDKKIAALEEDSKVSEVIEQSHTRLQEARQSIKNIVESTKDDVDLTDDEIVNILVNITDVDERDARSQQIQHAKEIKAIVLKKQEELDKDEKYNSGEEISFKG
jgi:hypothetical protein